MTKTPFIDLQSLLHAEMVFQEQNEGEEVFHQQELIELQPYGVSLVPDAQRPFLIFRDATQQYTLPVFLNPLEAGITLTQSNKSIAPTTPHSFALELLKSLQIRVLQCVFVQIKGPHQYVRVYMQGHPSLNSLKLRADEVMSFVLQAGVPVFATKGFINKSKLLNAQIEGLKAQDFAGRHQLVRKNQIFIQ